MYNRNYIWEFIRKGRKRGKKFCFWIFKNYLKLRIKIGKIHWTDRQEEFEANPVLILEIDDVSNFTCFGPIKTRARNSQFELHKRARKFGYDLQAFQIDK